MFYSLGRYVLFILRVFHKPEKWAVFRKQLVTEIQNLGIESLGIVAVISLFMGAVVSIQTAYNIDSPFIPLTMVGFTARQSIILEFSPTIISLILAGKVGSRIASEIGTMRVTEQIDALEIMGINPATHLVLPKIWATILFNPFMILISMVIGIFGGYLVCIFTNLITTQEYIIGLRYDYDGFIIIYALIKTVVFAFIITTISGYMGYFTKGGSLDVGRSSTRAVVWSSIVIILANLVLTQLLLA